MTTRTYARVDNGVVAEIFTLDSSVNLSSIFHQTTVATIFDVTGIVPAPEVGWTYSAGVFSAPAVLTGQPLKDYLTSYAGMKRYEIEIAGIMVGGDPVDTTRESQGQINGAWVLVQTDPSTTVQWKMSDGSWTTLTGAQITVMAEAVAAHVQVCFSTEKTLDEQITAGTVTNTAQIDDALNAIPHNN